MSILPIFIGNITISYWAHWSIGLEKNFVKEKGWWIRALPISLIWSFICIYYGN